MNNLDLLRPVAVFQAVVAQGSFRAAADSLGLSPPYVSQMISDLEARLGRQLLYRSTRKIALTEAGEAFLPPCRRNNRRLPKRAGQHEPRGKRPERSVARDRTDGCVRPPLWPRGCAVCAGASRCGAGHHT
ncbi:LysR family transcriptional regulator [Sulfitobacter sp.]|uniref:LysR family transcriptional regulator n=1 Tax=Sulfitobacter sp. TaxID=1903071 RepID=UPI003F6AF866